SQRSCRSLESRSASRALRLAGLASGVACIARGLELGLGTRDRLRGLLGLGIEASLLPLGGLCLFSCALRFFSLGFCRGFFRELACRTTGKLSLVHRGLGAQQLKRLALLAVRCGYPILEARLLVSSHMSQFVPSTTGPAPPPRKIACGWN